MKGLMRETHSLVTYLYPISMGIGVLKGEQFTMVDWAFAAGFFVVLLVTLPLWAMWDEEETDEVPR